MRPVIALLVFFNGFLLSDTYSEENQYSHNTLRKVIKLDTRLAETSPLISSRSTSNNDDANHGSPINSPKPNSVGSKGPCTVGKTIAERNCSRTFYQCIPPARLLKRSCSEKYRFDGSIKRCRLLSQMPECSKNSAPHVETKHHGPTKNVKTVVDTVEYLLPERPRTLYVWPAFDAFAAPTYPAGGDPFVYNAPAYPAQHSFNTQGRSPWQLDAFKAYMPPKTGSSSFGTPFYTPNVHDAFDVPYHQTHPYFPNSVPNYGEFQRDGETWNKDMGKASQKGFKKMSLFGEELDASLTSSKGSETVKPEEQSGTDGTADTEKNIDVLRTEDGLESEKSVLPLKAAEDIRQDQGEGDGYSNQPKAEGDSRQGQGEEDGHSNQPTAEGDNRQDQGEVNGHNSKPTAEGEKRQDQDEGDDQSNQAEEDERRGQLTESETTEDRTNSDKLASPYENDVTHLSGVKSVLQEVNKIASSPKPVASHDRTENPFVRGQDQESSESDTKGAMQTDEENAGPSENTEPRRPPDDRVRPSEVKTSPTSDTDDKVYQGKINDLAVKKKDETPAPETNVEVFPPETNDETQRRLPSEAVAKAADASLDEFKELTEGPLDEFKTTTDGSLGEAVTITTEDLPEETVKTTTEDVPQEAVKTTTESLTVEAVKKASEDDDTDLKLFNKTMSDADAEVDQTVKEESSLNKRDRRDVFVGKYASEQVHDAGNKVTSLPDPRDCRRFYVLIMGKWISFTCSGWTVFNPATGLCDLPENVPSCEAWNP